MHLILDIVVGYALVRILPALLILGAYELIRRSLIQRGG